MSEPLFRTPLIEGVMAESVTMSIFIKALTQGTRVIGLPADFADRPDHLERAAELVREHHGRYRLHDSMPLAYYTYIVSPGHSYRFSTEGRLLGCFHDHPTIAYVETEDGGRFTFGD